MPLLCMGHQISHFLPLGLHFLICELGITSLEDWASQDHCEALRALCEQDKASRAGFVYLQPSSEHAELGIRGGGVGRKCLSQVSGEKQWALRVGLPPCDPCPRALRKSPSWKAVGKALESRALPLTPPLKSSPVVTWVRRRFGHHQLGPWT